MTNPHDDRAVGDLIRESSLGSALLAIYIDEFLKHRDCDPPCIDAAEARQHLIACGVDPSDVVPLSVDALIEVHWARYYRHRNDPITGVCAVDNVANCEYARIAWRGLLDCGVDPVGGLGRT